MGYDVVTSREHQDMVEDVAHGIPTQRYKNMIDLFYHVEFDQWPDMWENCRVAYHWCPELEDKIGDWDDQETIKFILLLKEGK